MNELVFIRPFVLLSFGALEIWRSGKIEFPRLSTLVASLGNHFFEGIQKIARKPGN
jgi:hypothetical protein